MAFITCYMGKLPWYLRLFIKTCAANPDVHFILVTDAPCEMDLPPNFKWVNMDVHTLKELISGKTGLNVSLDYAYKLCDIKPAYGVVFEDYLEGYDFWGHCDIDIIFGCIRHFITEEILQAHDVICVVPEYVTGFFTLFRNTPYINRLYEQSRDYKKVFESDRHYCFDECNHLFNYLKKGRSILELKSEVDSMTHVVKRLAGEGRIRAYFNKFVVEARPGKMEWNNGVLIINRKYEILLYHLIEFKRLKNYFYPFGDNIPDRFYIGQFYFSRHAPQTIAGKFHHIRYTVTQKTRLLTRKMRNRLVGSAQIKRREFKNPEEFAGRYGHLVPTKRHTYVYLEHNSFLIHFPWSQPEPLYHIKKNIFYSRKWGIEIEFGYNSMVRRNCLHGMSLYNENQSEEYLEEKIF